VAPRLVLVIAIPVARVSSVLSPRFRAGVDLPCGVSLMSFASLLAYHAVLDNL
jgi:hypothetical protein